MQGVITGVVLIVVVAVTWPVYAGSRPVAGKTRCLSNLKQLSTAQLIYASDWDDAISQRFTFDGSTAQSGFYEANLPYTKNPEIFLCGESSTYRTDLNHSGKHVDFQHFPLILKQVGKDGLIHLDQIDAPDKVAWMHDPMLKIAKVTGGEEVETNHKKAPNAFVVSFFDGHAKWALTLKGGPTDAMTTDGVWLR